MKDKYFLDTNIIVYSFDSSDSSKQHIGKHLIMEALYNRKGCISYQVIQEFLNVAARKFAKPISVSDSQAYLVNVLEPLCEVFATTGLYYQALEINRRWGYSFYDSLIIGAALSAKCSTLYSEDLQHKQKIDSLEIVNPFA